MRRDERIRLSKTMAHALRHAPWLYGIELDEQGWVLVEDLLAGLRQHRNAWANLSLSDLQAVIDAPGKQRYAIKGDRICALYGHSKSVLYIEKLPAEPPNILYHGTSITAASVIWEQGLRPMHRQYVHHSTDVETAQQVGARRGERVIILTVYARAAHKVGVHFYRGNDAIWLSDEVPPVFIGFPSVGEGG